MRKIPFIISLLFLLISCADNKTILIDRIKPEPLNILEAHSVYLDKTFTERIVEASPLILSELNKFDSTDKYKNYKVTSIDKKMFVKYYDLLPAKFKEILNEKVIAIYFIKNFTGGGMTDYVFDRNGGMYAVIYLNSAVLHKSLNDWISYRDQSSFTNNNKKISIRSYCGSGNTGLLHVMVHESSHVYDYFNHVTPYVEQSLIKPEDKKNTEFVSEIWSNDKTPIASSDFPNRTSASAYGLGSKFDISQATVLYEALNRTPFSSLYGSSSWVEDFAETFTWYYLNKKYGIRYKVIVSRHDLQPVIFSPTENKSVKTRYKYLEKLVD